jgi:hypothetical protein
MYRRGTAVGGTVGRIEVSRDLLHAIKVRRGEIRVRVPGHESQVAMQDDDTISAGVYITVSM